MHLITINILTLLRENLTNLHIFVNSLSFFSFISSLERFSHFSYLVKTTVIAVVLQTNQIQHRMNE